MKLSSSALWSTPRLKSYPSILTLPAGISTDWTRTASVVAVGIADIAPAPCKATQGRRGEEEAKTPTGADTAAVTAIRTLRRHTEARVPIRTVFFLVQCDSAGKWSKGW